MSVMKTEYAAMQAWGTRMLNMVDVQEWRELTYVLGDFLNWIAYSKLDCLVFLVLLLFSCSNWVCSFYHLRQPKCLIRVVLVLHHFLVVPSLLWLFFLFNGNVRLLIQD